MKYLIGVIVFIIYGGLVFYIGWNIKMLLHSFNFYRWPIVYWAIFFILSFAFIIARLHPSFSYLSLVGNYWMMVLQYGIFLCLIANLLVWLTPLSSKVVGLGALSIFIVLFIAGTYFAYTPVVRTITVEIDKKGEPMRVVLASDFHLGYLSHKGHLENFVKLSNEQNPDLVLLAGDIVDDDPARYIETGMKDVMKQLKATYGVYGILGNHEYYGNKIDEFLEAMEESNVHILMDETVELENGVYLTGQEDLTNKLRKPIKDMTPDNLEAPWIVMNHTPSDLATPAETGVDLHVSGHTHKGQLWPNHLITERIFDLSYGHTIVNKMHALVSSGYGFWGPPMRIGSQAELWVIDIVYTE